MDENQPSGRKPATPRLEGKAAREARLADALRENLRRRKAQARAREAAVKPAEPAGEA